MMWQYGGDWGWGTGLWFGLHGLGMLFFWGLLILGIVLLVRMVAQSGTPAQVAARAQEPGEDTALATLRERYARGELTREQFQHMRDVLR